MSSEYISVERLDSGLQAAFVHMPHFRTHSARLTINAGSGHEVPGTSGSAHFLEHAVFQGTEAMPTEADLHNYGAEKGLSQNGFTNQTATTYVADGYELDSVSFFVSQLAFKPLLSEAGIESQRRPIIDEIRGYASSPYHDSNRKHSEALRGEAFADRILGDIEDVQYMPSETLRAFHERHYRVGNAVLVICSAEPIEKQREVVEALFTDGSPCHSEPTTVRFDSFNPAGLTASLEKVNLPTTAQTAISINYGLPETTSDAEQFGQYLVGNILSRAAHSRLRRELALCYGASAGVSRHVDLNFTNDKNWSHLTASANLNGEDSIVGLQALWNDVLHKPLPQPMFDSVLVSLRRDVDRLLESDPATIANRVKSIFSSSKKEEIALDEVKEFASSISLQTLHQIQKDMTDTKPLVIATSPDEQVLVAIGEWAASKH